MMKFSVAVLALLVSVPASAAGHASLNVRDFGAVGDGVHDDTLAIQKAADALYPGGIKDGRYVRTVRLRHVDGISDGANGEVFFPKGVYRVTGPVAFENSVNVRGEPGAVIRNVTKDKPTFYFSDGYRLRIDDLAFEGGSTQVRQWARNLTDASLFISRCSFSGASDAALVSVGFCHNPGGGKNVDARSSLAPYVVERDGDGRARLLDNHAGKELSWFWNSTLITVENCRFRNNAMAFHLASDGINMRNCIVRVPASGKGPAAQVQTSARMENVRFEIPGKRVDPTRCALAWDGGQMVLADCAFVSDADVLAVESRDRACSCVVSSSLRFLDTTLENGGAPLVRFTADAFPNMIVVDGLRAPSRPAARKRLFSFAREPSHDDLVRWQRDNTKGDSSVLPPMPVECFFGISLADVDAAAYDAALPAALAPYLRQTPADVRIRAKERVTYDFPFAGGVRLSDGEMGSASYADDGRDDTERLQTLFAKAAKAGTAEVTLPAGWLRVSSPVTVRGKVAVRVRGRAVVVGKDDIPIFRIAEGSEVLFENIVFNFGANAVSCDGKTGRLWFRNCFFYDQLHASVTAGLKRGDGPGWRIEMNGGCVDTAHFFSGAAKPFLIDGIWLTTAPDRPWKRHRASYACIENFEGGVMTAQGVCGVPRYFENAEVSRKTPGKVGDFRWFDNYGTLEVRHFRFGGERCGLTPIYNHPDASAYVEGSFSYHKNNGHLRPVRAAAAMSSAEDDVRFVDVVGFNFMDDPSFYVAVQDDDGSYSTRMCEGHVFNCLPYPSDGAKSR